MRFQKTCVLSLALGAMFASACSSSLKTFHCETSSDCESEGKVGGVCEAESVCSFFDDSCGDDSQRYSDLAGPLSNECVGGEPDSDAMIIVEIDAAVDADPNQPDSGTEFCGWGFDPVHFDACEDPPTTLDPLSLNLDDSFSYVYHTSQGTLYGPQGNVIASASTVLNSKRILWTSSFSIGTTAILQVIGDMPLVIASKSTIDIDGVVSVGGVVILNQYYLGAGSEPEACTQNPSGRGEDCAKGGAGGGGGAFGGNGGTGGNGALNRNDCDNPDEFGDGALESTGGTGGLGAPAPTLLRGGCAGKEGGEGDLIGTFAAGGSGAGALHLTAATTLSVTGVVHAGGAGGRKSLGNRSGGGGGGSGGMIGVEASTIDLATGAVVSANGGGGGGGGATGDEDAVDGEDAPVDGGQALGGAPASSGTAGGHGGWLNDTAGGSLALSAERGGGGGGGGTGYILYYQDSSPDLSATISPAPVAGL